MASYRRKRRRRSAVRPASVRGAERKPTRRGMPKSTARKRGGFLGNVGAFARHNLKWILSGALVVVVVVIALVLFLPGGTPEQGDDTAANVPAEEQTPPDVSVVVGDFDEESEYSTEGLDAETLAGLEGTDDSLFSAVDEDMADALFAEEGLRIGVTIGDLKTDTDEAILSKLEEAGSMAKTGKIIFDAYYFNAHGDYNQQLQDVRSLIKNEVDVIVVVSTEKTQFDMVVSIAAAEGIPVVAYNAPDSIGYAVNVVADQSAWGRVYGEFMASNLPAGDVICFFGSEDSAIDAQRVAAIRSALAANPEINLLEPVYAKWNGKTAGAAMAEYLEENDAPAGVICEEGMAEAVLQAYIDAGAIPKVMCGDATAGFLQLVHALKTTGVDITPPPEDDADPEQTPTPVMLTAQKGELVIIAQPAPVSIGAVAFDLAVKLAEGRQLKTEGLTYVYRVETVITDDNLVDYYVTVESQEDDYVVRDTASSATIEALLKPAKETDG